LVAKGVDSWMVCFNIQHSFGFKFSKIHILTMGCCCIVNFMRIVKIVCGDCGLSPIQRLPHLYLSHDNNVAKATTYHQVNHNSKKMFSLNCDYGMGRIICSGHFLHNLHTWQFPSTYNAHRS
jgi:hypothetical protein